MTEAAAQPEAMPVARRSKYDWRSFAVDEWRMYAMPRGNVRSAASRYGMAHGKRFETFHVKLIQLTVVKRTA